MKVIFKLIFVILLTNLTINLGSCQSEKAVRDKLVNDFEHELKLLFDKERIEEADYTAYLIGINNMTIPREFFKSKEKVQKATDFRNDDLFKTIWEKKSIIDKNRVGNDFEILIEPPRTAGDENDIRLEPDYYQINPDSKFLNDLINQAKNPEIQLLFKEVQKTGDLAPPIISNKLIEIGDFKDDSVKKYVAFQFYWDFIFMINGMNQIK